MSDNSKTTIIKTETEDKICLYISKKKNFKKIIYNIEIERFTIVAKRLINT